MASNYECAASALLCTEDNSSILGFDDDDEERGGVGCGWVSEVKSCDFYGDFLVDFPVQSDECVGLLVEREAEHMPREDYADRLRSGALDLAIRRDAIDWICKVALFFHFSSWVRFRSHFLVGFITIFSFHNFLIKKHSS